MTGISYSPGAELEEHADHLEWWPVIVSYQGDADPTQVRVGASCPTAREARTAARLVLDAAMAEARAKEQRLHDAAADMLATLEEVTLLLETASAALGTTFAHAALKRARAVIATAKGETA